MKNKTVAAWLAFLKSQLLLPVAERQEPDAEAMAEELALRLRAFGGVWPAPLLEVMQSSIHHLVEQMTTSKLPL